MTCTYPGQLPDLPSLDPLVFASVARKHHWGPSSLARGSGPELCISVYHLGQRKCLVNLCGGGRALCEAHEGAGRRGRIVTADFRTTAKTGFHPPWGILLCKVFVSLLASPRTWFCSWSHHPAIGTEKYREEEQIPKCQKVPQAPGLCAQLRRGSGLSSAWVVLVPL